MKAAGPTYEPKVTRRSSAAGLVKRLKGGGLRITFWCLLNRLYGGRSTPCRDIDDT